MKVRLKLRLRSWFEAQLEGAAPLASSPPRFETAASHVSEVLCARPTSPDRRRCYRPPHVRIRSVRSHVVKAHSRRPGIPAPPECLRRSAKAGSQLFICLSDARLACRRVYRVQAVNVECDC